MPAIGEEKQQLEQLTNALGDMKQYVERLESGCAGLTGHFHDDRAATLEKLSQVIEGLGYCSQLLRSAVILLKADAAGTEKGSVAFFQDALSQLFADIDQAADAGDYSLLADLTEYDLAPLIQHARQLLQMLQRQCREGNG